MRVASSKCTVSHSMCRALRSECLCVYVLYRSIAGQLHQSWLPPSVPSGSSHQVTETGVHDTHPTVDIRTVIQGQYGEQLLKVSSF